MLILKAAAISLLFFAAAFFLYLEIKQDQWTDQGM